MLIPGLRFRTLSPFLALVLLVACREARSAKQEGPGTAPLPPAPTWEAVFGTEKENAFRFPVWFGEVPGKPGAFLVLERGGGPQDARIFVLEEKVGDKPDKPVKTVKLNKLVKSDKSDKPVKWTRRPFLTLPVSSTSAASDERGLLGLAFHPKYAENRRYFLYYMPAKQAFEEDSTVIAEFRADATLLKDAGKKPRRILGIEQPYANHNGGSVGFGPKDGKLYIGTGDGGAAGDPQKHAQDLSSLLGKMLRIDVDDTTGGRPYGIPQDNPFVQGSPQAAAPPRHEIWAYGLRNPWKWSFDPETGKLWAGDVGQNNREEIDVIGKGENHGWRIMEGFACFDPPRGCQQEGLTLPVADIPRSEAESITGGYVYRGNASSPYFGAYFFGDWETKAWWVIMPDHKPGTPPRKLGTLPDQPSSFGTDAAGNLYMVGYRKGTIYRAAL